jgi:hypothetical protein
MSNRKKQPSGIRYRRKYKRQQGDISHKNQLKGSITDLPLVSSEAEPDESSAFAEKEVQLFSAWHCLTIYSYSIIEKSSYVIYFLSN